MPGVQNPHCRASRFDEGGLTGLIFSGVPSPSTVVISWPTASAASIRQEAIGSPSSSTVQPPQAPRSQISLAPGEVEVVAQGAQQRHARLDRHRA